jgi:hypothetical protein
MIHLPAETARQRPFLGENERPTALPERLIAGIGPDPAQRTLLIAQHEFLSAAQGASFAQWSATTVAQTLPFAAQRLLIAQQTLDPAQHEHMIREQSLPFAQQRLVYSMQSTSHIMAVCSATQSKRLFHTENPLEFNGKRAATNIECVAMAMCTTHAMLTRGDESNRTRSHHARAER